MVVEYEALNVIIRYVSGVKWLSKCVRSEEEKTLQ